MKKKPIPPTGGNVIQYCTFTNEAFKVDEHAAKAIVAISDALAENARALGKLAERVAGPVDQRTALMLDGMK